MTHSSDIALGDCRAFRSVAFGRIGFQHLYSIPGFETAEDCRAFHAGERTLFDELADWLDDDVFDGHVVGRRDDHRGLFWLAIESPIDAVMFKLMWSDRLPQSVWDESVVR